MRAYKRIKMFVHAEGKNDDLNDGDLSCFIRLGTDFTSNFYEYEISLKATPHFAPEQIWPEANEIDIAFEIFNWQNKREILIMLMFHHPILNIHRW